VKTKDWIQWQVKTKKEYSGFLEYSAK
jgi:hypothetical protein